LFEDVGIVEKKIFFGGKILILRPSGKIREKCYFGDLILRPFFGEMWGIFGFLSLYFVAVPYRFADGIQLS
jgi:hypothetical protein